MAFRHLNRIDRGDYRTRGFTTNAVLTAIILVSLGDGRAGIVGGPAMTRPANLHAVHACLADSSITPFCLVGTIFPSSVPKRRGKPIVPDCGALFPERKGPWSQS